MKIKHFVEFCYPGFDNAGEIEQIESHDLKNVRVKKGARSFVLFDCVDVFEIIDDKKVKVDEIRTNREAYTIGNIVTLKEIKNQYGADSRIYTQMKERGENEVVMSETGEFAYANIWTKIIHPDQINSDGSIDLTKDIYSL